VRPVGTDDHLWSSSSSSRSRRRSSDECPTPSRESTSRRFLLGGGRDEAHLLDRRRGLRGRRRRAGDDETVSEFTLLEATGDRRLYSGTLSERGEKHLTYPTAAEYDIAYLDVTVTKGTRIRARVPTREALFAYRDACRERDIPFRIERIFSESTQSGDRYEITDRQREALLIALEEGYFDVPRRRRSAVAAKLDISDQALSAASGGGRPTCSGTRSASVPP